MDETAYSNIEYDYDQIPLEAFIKINRKGIKLDKHVARNVPEYLTTAKIKNFN